MPRVSNDDLMGVLLDIKSDIGSLKQQAAGHTAWMSKHVEDDKALAADVHELQINAAKSRGFIKAWALVATAIGALVGYFVEYLGLRHH